MVCGEITATKANNLGSCKFACGQLVAMGIVGGKEALCSANSMEDVVSGGSERRSTFTVADDLHGGLTMQSCGLCTCTKAEVRGSFIGCRDKLELTEKLSVVSDLPVELAYGSRSGGGEKMA